MSRFFPVGPGRVLYRRERSPAVGPSLSVPTVQGLEGRPEHKGKDNLGGTRVFRRGERVERSRRRPKKFPKSQRSLILWVDDLRETSHRDPTGKFIKQG